MEKNPFIGLLIVFYLKATLLFCHGEPSGMSCSPGEIRALLDFRSGLNDPEGRLSSWRGSNCCQWRGIGCNNRTGAVIKVDLHNPYPVFSDLVVRYGFWNLSGEVKPSLLELKSLIHLDLSSNTFEYIPIPDFLGSLNNLQYLNLSGAGFSGRIPPTLGNLSGLQYLDLSSGSSSLSADNFHWVTGLVSLKHLEMDYVDLSSIESDWIEKLNVLPSLTELHLSFCGLSGSVSSLSSVNFTSLVVLDLRYNAFGLFPNWLVNISGLEYVDLRDCNLRGRIPLGFSQLPNLRFLNLAFNNNLTANSRQLLNGHWNRIEVLNLALNNIHGKLPAAIGNMTYLTRLNLVENNIEGGIPSTIGGLCNLVEINMAVNKLDGSLPQTLEGTDNCPSRSGLPSLEQFLLNSNQLTGRLPEWLGQLRSLKVLSLGYNQLEGVIPASLGRLEGVTDIFLAGNKLSGALPESFGKLSELNLIDVSFNRMSGLIGENHFSGLRNLKFLLLASNSFSLNVSSDWIPPFQVLNLGMGSCKIGPSFPAWLQHQKEIQYLDISNASFSGPVPEWFWDLSSNLTLLNISSNQLGGQLPNPLSIAPYANVDLSSNFFEGAIPLPVVTIELLDLSNNRFQGHIPQNMSKSISSLVFLSLSGNQLTGDIPATIGEMQSLNVVDLSGNSLTGTIPSSIGNCSDLNALDLGNNSLSGVIPSSLGRLSQLQSLHLNDNNFSGELPSSLQNVSSLETLDLGNNLLSGITSLWFEEGNFTNLRILILRSNRFSGDLSNWNISNLSSLQVLDLAENDFTGQVPASFGDLKAMARKPNVTEYLLYGRIGNYRGVYYEEGIVINYQNIKQKYTKTLSLLTAIDVSGNNFSGEFPVGLTKLSGLLVLNMSRNRISGQIPQNISSLGQLLSLDLSGNRLSGTIPPSMASMSSLSFLNLTNNNFSGAIPYTGQLSTFGNASFEGNPNLCGGPLEECQKEDSDREKDPENHSNDGDFPDKWFYLTLGVGFAAGILVPYLILAIRRPWADAYFGFVDDLVYRLTTFMNRKPSRRNIRPQ